jgi:hypothetical protein
VKPELLSESLEREVAAIDELHALTTRKLSHDIRYADRSRRRRVAHAKGCVDANPEQTAIVSDRLACMYADPRAHRSVWRVMCVFDQPALDVSGALQRAAHRAEGSQKAIAEVCDFAAAMSCNWLAQHSVV